jgi:hypothetical protein
MDHSYSRKVLAGVVILAGLLTAGATAPHADGTRAAAAGDWLSSYSGARTLGLGGAFVAAADDPLGVIWNPAGLNQLFQNEVHFENARLFEGTSINAIALAVPARRIPTMGFTMVALSSGGFERTNELNESLGSFSETEMAFIFTASKSLSPRLGLGANVKVVRQAVEDFGATGVGADLGVLYHLTSSVRVGASLLNLGGPNLTLRETSESYPFEFRGGVSVETFSGRGLISLELDHRAGVGTMSHAGTEYWVHPAMALRLGYDDSNPTGGFSFRPMNGIRVDYGLSDHGLGSTHRLAISYRFGGFFASSEAVPPVFSPIGQQSVTKFHLKAISKAEVQDWNLEIRDKANHVVRRFGGEGKPPSHLMWDGKGESGIPLPDGTYSYQLVVIDLEGRELVAQTRTVEIATEGPQGTVPVVVGVGIGSR